MNEIKRWLLEPGFKDIKERFMDGTVLIEGFLNFSGPLHPPIKRVSLRRYLIGNIETFLRDDPLAPLSNRLRSILLKYFSCFLTPQDQIKMGKGDVYLS
jgi:hypothetical protein